MKMYDKKFLINGNCTIRSFGQTGLTPRAIFQRFFFRSKHDLPGFDRIHNLGPFA